MNRLRVGRPALGPVLARVLQQNAPLFVPGGLTGLGHRQSRLVEGVLQGVSGTELGTKCNAVRGIQSQPGAGMGGRERAHVARRVSQVGQGQADTGAGPVVEYEYVADDRGRDQRDYQPELVRERVAGAQDRRRA